MAEVKGLNRRQLGLLAANMGIATLGGFAGNVMAQEAPKVLLGAFPSANPQNFSKATGSMQKAMGDKAKVEYVGASSGPQIITAMAGNSMDLANIGSTPMCVAFAQGLPISMVYVHKAIRDDECLVVRNDSGIKTLADLKGKKVACPFNTSVHFALLAAMKTVNLTAANVTLVNLKADGILAAWQRKEIDAAYIWNPVAPKLVADGGATWFHTGDLAGKGTVLFDAIIVRNAFKEKYPELVLAYLKELNRIYGIYRNTPEQVADVLSPYLQIPREVALSIAKQTHTITPADMATDAWMGTPGSRHSGVLKSIAAQMEFLKNSEQINAVPADVSKFVDTSFLAKMAA